MTDLGNRFHYYRATHDGRILFGGYDATYHFGGAAPEDSPSRVRSYRTLAGHFFETFPQLEGLCFSHRWFGVIDTTSRFTPMFGTAHDGRVAYAVGFTGLGVGASRFGARVALDLVDGRRTERTALRMVTTRPVPFPPEPVRYPLIRVTQSALAREDRTGRRGAYLQLLDRFGVGFDSERPDRPTPYPRGPPMTDGLHIDGARRSGAGPVRVLVDPSTGEPMDEVTEATPAQTAEAVASSRAAFPGWADRTAGERARVLLRLADLVEDHAVALTELEVRESGKPWATFLDGELPFAADNLRFFAGSARSLEGTGAGVLSQGYTSMIVRRPVGVVGAIAPWNFPFVMGVWKVGPALAAGNAVVLKPAPTTPGSSCCSPSSRARPACPPGVLNVRDRRRRGRGGAGRGPGHRHGVRDGLDTHRPRGDGFGCGTA